MQENNRMKSFKGSKEFHAFSGRRYLATKTASLSEKGTERIEKTEEMEPNDECNQKTGQKGL